MTNHKKDASKTRKPLNRPPTRNIVRWDDELDRKLLLAIQSACNKLGVRIPWDEVASMVTNTTGSAIVQHLAKLRTKMIQAGQEVPPPLRRSVGGPAIGATTASQETIAAPTDSPVKKARGRKRMAKPSSSDHDDEEYVEDRKRKAPKGNEHKSKAGKASKAKRKSKRAKLESDEETEDSGVDGFEGTSDGDSTKEVAKRNFAATGEGFTQFQYVESGSVNASSRSESFASNELNMSQERDEKATIPSPVIKADEDEDVAVFGANANQMRTDAILNMNDGEVGTFHNANESGMGVQGFQAIEQPGISAGQFMAAPYSMEAPVNIQQGFGMINRPPLNEPSPFTSFDTQTLGDHESFFTGIPARPFQHQFPQAVQLPFPPLESLDPRSVFDLPLANAGPAADGFDWPSDTVLHPETEETFFSDFLHQQPLP